MGFGSLKSNNPFRHSSSSNNNNNNNNNHNNHNNDIDNVPPPPGPPPSYRPAAASGAGPPPSSEQQYAPPPGPPPSYGTGKGGRGEKGEFHDDDDFAPPPGPPPPQQQPQPQLQPQHDWEQAVPDTSLLPPPPDIFSGWDRSPAANATEEQAEAGEAWCRSYPLSPPTDLQGAGADPGLMRAGIVPRLIAPPPAVFGKGSTLVESGGPGSGTWTVRTDRRAGDCCIIGYPHAYLVQRDSPLATGRAKTVYLECRVGTQLGDKAGLAVGFQALPYPPFRMPGWHRGSLAVHGDDGHKYVNDRWGGKDFTGPFAKGEVVGIGMVLSPTGVKGGGDGDGDSKGKSKGKGADGIQVEVFFTRGGREVGRWDMHESLDFEKDLPITGLEGFHDLTVAIGTYGAVTAEVVLDPSRWLFKP